MANAALSVGDARQPPVGDLAAAAAVRRRLRQALLLMNRSLASNELSALQYHLLLEVAVAGATGLNQVSLADLLAVPEGRISYLVQELKNRALVTQTKSEHNRRIATVHLTSKGRRVLAKAMEAQRRVLAKMVTGIPQDELAAMVEWGVREYLQIPEPLPSYDWR
jgi:DNA-binding MarR family transcriptional regulator